MIKYKFVQLKLHDRIKEVAELGKRINENLFQFGAVCKNKHFSTYIKDTFTITNTVEKNNNNFKQVPIENSSPEGKKINNEHDRDTRKEVKYLSN
jgi:hypothetical protein